MSNLWPAATKEKPCPICQHHDWTCRFGDRAILCMRVPSAHPCDSGGWYHFYDAAAPKPFSLPKRKPVEPLRNAAELIDKWREETESASVVYLADRLGVSIDALFALDAVYAKEHKAWAFPMRDGATGEVCGIRLRNDKGEKWAVKGSRQGLFIPVQEAQGTVFLPEGPTDTAALLALSFYAIGRPSCNAAFDQVKAALKRMSIARAVVVADNDTIKASGARPGYESAVALKKYLSIPSIIFVPPHPLKDVREMVRKGATRALIESLTNKTWRKQ